MPESCLFVGAPLEIGCPVELRYAGKYSRLGSPPLCLSAIALRTKLLFFDNLLVVNEGKPRVGRLGPESDVANAREMPAGIGKADSV